MLIFALFSFILLPVSIICTSLSLMYIRFFLFICHSLSSPLIYQHVLCCSSRRRSARGVRSLLAHPVSLGPVGDQRPAALIVQTTCPRPYSSAGLCTSSRQKSPKDPLHLPYRPLQKTFRTNKCNTAQDIPTPKYSTWRIHYVETDKLAMVTTQLI